MLLLLRHKELQHLNAKCLKGCCGQGLCLWFWVILPGDTGAEDESSQLSSRPSAGRHPKKTVKRARSSSPSCWEEVAACMQQCSDRDDVEISSGRAFQSKPRVNCPGQSWIAYFNVINTECTDRTHWVFKCVNSSKTKKTNNRRLSLTSLFVFFHHFYLYWNSYSCLLWTSFFFFSFLNGFCHLTHLNKITKNDFMSYNPPGGHSYWLHQGANRQLWSNTMRGSSIFNRGSTALFKGHTRGLVRLKLRRAAWV